MKPTETKERFILLRSKGESIRSIAKELNISVSTAQRWNNELESQIKAKSERFKEEMNQLYEMYGMNRIAQIKAYGEELKAIDKAITSKDYNSMSMETLLNLKLKYMNQLNKLYVPLDQQDIKLDTFEEIQEEMNQLYIRVMNKQIDKNEAVQCFKILSKMMDIKLDQMNEW